jgi:putative transposase
MRLVEETLRSIPVDRPTPWKTRQNLCMDKGYDYDAVRDTVDAFGDTAHIHRRGEQRALQRAMPRYRTRRWVCERTHSWMNRFRRLLIRWEKKVQNFLGLLHFVRAYITFNAAGVLG